MRLRVSFSTAPKSKKRMGGHNLKYISTPVPFIIFILFVFLLQVSVVRAQDGVCKTVDCAKGTCVPSNSILGFDCVCDGGWKQVQIGPVTLPACIIPNCTMDVQCGNNAPPPPPFELPPFNLTNPCSLMWCGDGTCVANGTGSHCQCNEGSANLLNSTALPCFRQCSVGADCSGLELGPRITPSPPKSNGSNSISKSSRSYALNMGLLSAVTLSLILTLPRIIS